MTTDRACLTAGLRNLADALDAHPGIPAPFDLERSLSIFFHISQHTRTDFDSCVSLLGGPLLTVSTAAGENFGIRVTGELGGLNVTVHANLADYGTVTTPTVPAPAFHYALPIPTAA